ncbi:MAG TPA: cysteine--1-D-myo-inosityl 2-amino-2-deoxy-alpha-D-glucopyranoside ligase [Aeromicrobium sp.]|nr:cysteine--1-D-myo-inosityl 2-amino-2-deoxy-alpha-D-glucopyranoside ligase [Aeromicrobium sp.]HKY56761.1 cysteine--1-D-myo-inosityl 2-amino-2-deoxy-alpha-D-glucopyranoside ligase [Aeromicrobium sp.]
MRSWPAVHVPRLAGHPPPLRVHDSREHGVVPLEVGDQARLYVCGITPYDATHLGHAATYLAFDLLYRQWLDRGVQVTYAQNITDVDDPLLERARATGEPWADLAGRETELFRQDMTALRILPPHHFIGVVEALPDVAKLIESLDGAVYRVEDDLYLDVHADAAFGSIAGLSAEQMRALSAQRGGDPDRPGKRDPLDCLVWRAPRAGEPSWETVIGAGRPGWHVECAAIGLTYLGEQFDVQGGGSDLLFPHHELCASHVRLATGQPAARAYVHAGMVAYRGEKMSKSLGNLVLVSELRDDGDAKALRLALLAHHYRSDWEWTELDLPAAAERLARWRLALERPTHPPAEPLIARLRAELSEDLNAPGALAAVDAWCASSGAATDGAMVRDALDALLGVAL